jgi:hypothetical protein
MSWLPQRWRTQRNAIRHANCITPWVIKTLNAPCTPFGVYLLEYLFSPTKKDRLISIQFWVDSLFLFGNNLFRWTNNNIQDLFFSDKEDKREWNMSSKTISDWISSCLLSFSCKSLSYGKNCIYWLQISSQIRLPAEFKHITKRRKRN